MPLGAIWYDKLMSNLAEIEAAVQGLSPEEKQRLLRFVAASVGSTVLEMPEPRDFSLQQMQGWIAEDEEDMRRFNEGK